MEFQSSANDRRAPGAASETPGATSPAYTAAKTGCGSRKDRSWVWLVAAFVVLLGGIVMLILLLFRLPGLRA